MSALFLQTIDACRRAASVSLRKWFAATAMLSAGAVLAMGPLSQAASDEILFGLVTKVYRANGKIGVQLLENGAAGMNGAIVDFDVLDGVPFEQVEPGDRLRFNIEQIGGVWTITRFQRQ